MAERPSVAIVGGGFGGIGAAVMLQREGYDDVTVFERGDRVGGVWNFNTYPGIACDVPSHLYEFCFAPQPRLVATVRPGRRDPGVHGGRGAPGTGCSTGSGCARRSPGARFDDQRGRWLIQTTARPHEADVLVTACGQLSVPEHPVDPRSRRLRRSRLSTPPAGATTWISRAGG